MNAKGKELKQPNISYLKTLRFLSW